MPVYLNFCNIIFNKQSIEEKFKGGVNAFKELYITDIETIHQEDNQLFCLDRWDGELEKNGGRVYNTSPDESEIQEFVENGLSFDAVKHRSPDFVYYHRLTKFSWHVDWLHENTVFAWHTDCKYIEYLRAEELSNLSMDEINAIEKNGIKLLTTIRL